MEEHYRGLSSAMKKAVVEYGSPQVVRVIYRKDSIESEHRVADLMGGVVREVLGMDLRVLITKNQQLMLKELLGS